MISGDSLALQKTSWRLVAWEMEPGEFRSITATKEVTMMGDGKGAYTVIDFKSPDVANEGLGYCICPDRNQDHAYAATMTDMRDLRHNSQRKMHDKYHINVLSWSWSTRCDWLPWQRNIANQLTHWVDKQYYHKRGSIKICRMQLFLEQWVMKEWSSHRPTLYRISSRFQVSSDNWDGTKQ